MQQLTFVSLFATLFTNLFNNHPAAEPRRLWITF